MTEKLHSATRTWEGGRESHAREEAEDEAASAHEDAWSQTETPGEARIGQGPHHHASPPAAELPSGLLQTHGPHPLQLAPADSIHLAAGTRGPLAPQMGVGEQHGGQLAIHICQLLRLDHIFCCWKVQRES